VTPVTIEQVNPTALPDLAGSVFPGALIRPRTATSVLIGDRTIAELVPDPGRTTALLQALATTPLRDQVPQLAPDPRPDLLVTTVPATAAAAVPLSRAVVRTGGADRVGRELARFLAALHDPATPPSGVDLPVLPSSSADPLDPVVTTGALRERFTRFVPAAQRARVLGWCAWADQVLAEPAPLVLAHGALHAPAQRWSPDARLVAVLDWGSAGLAEPEYDLRDVPLDGGMAVLRATVAHYQDRTGRRLSTARAMAWHLRTILGTALRHCEAGRPLPDARTPAEWVHDLTRRFASLAR
jgi:hypothetical protein